MRTLCGLPAKRLPNACGSSASITITINSLRSFPCYPQIEKSKNEPKTACQTSREIDLVDDRRQGSRSLEFDLADIRHKRGLGRVFEVLVVVAAMISMRKRFTAHVVFQGAEHRRFWRIFTRRGWRHVYVVLPVFFPEPGLSAIRYSQVINFWTDHVRSDVVFLTPDQVCQAALKDGATCVISIPIDQKFTGRYVPRGLFTCVSMVKALLSIDAWHVWTPEQLATWLLRNGGRLMEKSET